MKNKLFLILTACLITSSYSQDSIVNYLDNMGKIVDKVYATQIETIVKKDTLWQVTKYYGNGKIKTFGHFKIRDKKEPIGESIRYHRNGKVSNIRYYNKKSKKNGRDQTWFDNGKLSIDGTYLSDKKEGIWKYYHYNGIEASRIYYKNDSILKSIIFDDGGKQLNTPLITRNAKFIGGQEKFKAEINKLTKGIGYKIKGKGYVNFVVGINGEIRDVVIYEELPEELHQKIVAFFEAIEGWEPAIHMNRKIPVDFTLPLKFRIHRKCQIELQNFSI